MKNFVSLLFIGAIVVLGVLVGKGDPTTNRSSTAATATSPSLASVTAQNTTSPAAINSGSLGQGGALSGYIYVVTRSQNATEVSRLDVVTKEKKVIYSDRDEAAKIQWVADLSPKGDSLVAFISNEDDPAGQLITFNIDGSAKKTVLISGFVATEPATLSPDQSKLALTGFSNDESAPGFTLTVMDITGQNKKELVRDPAGISHPVFASDSRSVLYIKGKQSVAQTIVSVDIVSGKQTELYRPGNQLIGEFANSSAGPLVVTARSTGQDSSQSEVYLIDVNTKSTKQTTKNKTYERSPHLAPDGSALAYIDVSNSNESSGKIVISQLVGSDMISIGTASQIIGWTKE